MKQVLKSWVALLVLFFVTVSVADDFECPNYIDGAYADINDCRSYYRCKSGVAYKHTCPDGLYYHQLELECDLPQNTDCIEDSGVFMWRGVDIDLNDLGILVNNGFCDKLEDGMYQNPEDCGTFYHCSNQLTYLKDCPASLHFSESRQKCLYPQHAGCQDNNGTVTALPSTTTSPIVISTERPVTDGPCLIIFTCEDKECDDYPDPCDCQSFYRCGVNGTLKDHRNCSEGLLFNPITLACDYSENVDCEVTVGPITTTTPSDATTPEGSSEEDTTPKESSEEDTTAKESSEEDTTPKESSEEDTTPKDSSEEETTIKESSEEDTTPKDSSEEETTVKESSEEDTTPKESSEEDTTPKESSEEDTTAKESSEEDTTPKESSEEDTTPKESSEEDTTPKESSEEDTTIKESSEEDTTPKESSEEDTTPKESSEEDTTIKESSEEDTTPKESSEEDTTPKDSSEEDTTPKESSEEDTTPKESSEEDTTPKDSSEEDTTPKESSEEDTTPKESSEEDTTPKESSEEDTTPFDSGEDDSCDCGLHGVPGDCGKYYICVNGDRRDLECFGGLHFDMVSWNCLPPAKATCA